MRRRKRRNRCIKISINLSLFIIFTNSLTLPTLDLLLCAPPSSATLRSGMYSEGIFFL